uniref:Uncharacterized protein n=1 Tax=Meloidogyne javanica TaxID=6303 RepID=A0A915MC98_MELJA
MNHCIPNRRLRPFANVVNSGFVVTSPLAGEYVHYVFCDKNSPLFKMPIKLFRCSEYIGMKNTEIIRRERTLEFGDGIYFTSDNRGVVLDYEKSMKVYETNCNYDKNLIKTICVLPPFGHAMKIWSELFGNIQLSKEKWNEANLQANNDVPIFTWISIQIDTVKLKLVPEFDEFIEVAVDERKIAWETDWNEQKTNPNTSKYTWDTTDDEEEIKNVIVEKKEGEVLDVKLKLEGYLIGRRELFCPELRHNRVNIGLWEKHLSKFENLPLGCKFRFDAYFNDILQIYIAYYYEDITTDEVCWVDMDEDEPEKTTIQLRLFPSDTFGQLYNNPEFGLIFDPKKLLSPLTYLFAELEVDEVWVNVIDTGPDSKKICRFVMIDEQPACTRDVIQAAKDMAEKSENNIIDEGFIIDSKGTFFSPRNATLKFEFPESERDNFPVGHWTRFEAKYDSVTNKYFIIGGELILEKRMVPNSLIEYATATDNEKMEKYQKKRVKCYKLIVEFEEADANSQSLVKLIRMAKPNELMDSDKRAKNSVIPFSNNADDSEEEIGLEDPDEMEEDEGPISQVDYLSKCAIRERKMLARERKRTRLKLEKQMLEQQKQLLEESKL